MPRAQPLVRLAVDPCRARPEHSGSPAGRLRCKRPGGAAPTLPARPGGGRALRAAGNPAELRRGASSPRSVRTRYCRADGRFPAIRSGHNLPRAQRRHTRTKVLYNIPSLAIDGGLDTLSTTERPLRLPAPRTH
jgi:hypothetical protein